MKAIDKNRFKKFLPTEEQGLGDAAGGGFGSRQCARKLRQKIGTWTPTMIIVVRRL
jgi:hypothetical protein